MLYLNDVTSSEILYIRPTKLFKIFILELELDFTRWGVIRGVFSVRIKLC